MKAISRIWILGLACCASAAGLGFGARVAAAARTEIHLHIFRSKDCPSCDLIEPAALSRLAERTGCSIKPRYFDIEDPDNYKLLMVLERKYKKDGNRLPVVFVGKRVLGGVEEIEKGLENTVRELARSGGASPIPLPSDAEIEQFFSSNTSGPIIHMAYFEQPGCRHCQRVEHMLRHCEKRWPALRVKRYATTDREHKILLEALCGRAGVPEDRRLVVPAVFVRTHALIGSDITDDSLAEWVTRYSASGAADPTVASEHELAAARERLVKRFRAIGLVAIVTGGLVDGVNPCAFATVVFFVTYLAALGKTKRRILEAGVAFCGGVFIAYFAAGIGLSESLLHFQAVPILALVLRWGIVTMVSALALVSFYDAWVARRGEPKAMLLKVPSRLRARMNAIISRHSRSNRLLLASFLLGLILSAIEFVCTGQVYLPLIQLMVSFAVDRLHTLSLLLIYNLAFCVPLLVVFLAVFAGASSERLNGLLTRHIASAKILLGILFAGLAGILVVFG